MLRCRWGRLRQRPGGRFSSTGLRAGSGERSWLPSEGRRRSLDINDTRKRSSAALIREHSKQTATRVCDSCRESACILWAHVNYEHPYPSRERKLELGEYAAKSKSQV